MAESTQSTPFIRRIRQDVRDQTAYRVRTPGNIEVKLNQNESPYDLPEELKNILVEELRSIEFNRYPTDHPEELIAALSDHTGHPSEGILVGNGSNELTHTLGLTFIEPDGPVVLPRPMFSLYESVVRLYGGAVVGIAPRSDLSFDSSAVVEAIRMHDPALTVLTTPNNPTGLAMDVDEIREVVDAANGFVLVDEAYVEFNPGGSAFPLLHDHPNVLLMRTFSKAFGLAGLRIGYLMGHPEVIAEIMKARLPFMVDRFAERAALTLLQHVDLIEERVEQLRQSVQMLAENLANLERVDVRPTEANFVIFKPHAEPSSVMARLASAGVLVRNMGGYTGLEGFLRVNAGNRTENKAFLAALEKALYDVAAT